MLFPYCIPGSNNAQHETTSTRHVDACFFCLATVALSKIRENTRMNAKLSLYTSIILFYQGQGPAAEVIT